MSKLREQSTPSVDKESRIRAFCTGIPAVCGVPEDIAKIEALSA